MHAEKCVLFPVPLTFHTLSLSPATILSNGTDGCPRARCQRGSLGHRGSIQGSSCIRRPLAVLRYKHNASTNSLGWECSREISTPIDIYARVLLPGSTWTPESLLRRNAASLAWLHFCSACQGGWGCKRKKSWRTHSPSGICDSCQTRQYLLQEMSQKRVSIEVQRQKKPHH